MNKRIFELLKQATTDVNPEDREWVFSRVDQAKFAELIVQECACIADDMKTLETARAIKEHFGVEL